MAEISQCIDVMITDEVNAAAITAIATVRPAKRDVFFTTKADHTGSTISGDDIDSCFIDKTHLAVFPVIV
jgi:hypothetical protein